jgi:hypothetical protein
MMPSVSPSNALSPRVMLASAMHAQPGVYALLLGSGVSRSAGIPTGWEIVQDLVRKAAVAQDPEDEESHALAAADPERWWQENGSGDLGYSSLLAAFASSSAARQGLLAKYFVASENDQEAGRKQPTAAHTAVADLVKAGWVKVVITTNFDRLIEQGLDAAGVAYQVISRPEAIKASAPLAHAGVTVIKLHGDWTDLQFRNTIDELDKYPKPWRDLLARVFNEYGLLISGWSAEWDKALVRVLESTPRRYPLYWDSRSTKKPAAKNLLQQHGGHVIEAADADQLFVDLLASIDALQRLSEPPLTTAMAISRLKRALPDPLRRIELRDLIRGRAEDATAPLGVILSQALGGDVGEFLDSVFEATKPLFSLLVQGVRYDDGVHTNVWIEALQWLMDARPREANALLHYPALLALRAMSIEAVLSARDGILIELLTQPRWRENPLRAKAINAAEALHINRVIPADLVNTLPTSQPRGWKYPSSHLLKEVLAKFFADNGIVDARYETVCDDVEYRTGLVQHLLGDHPNGGEFVDDSRWEDLSNNWQDRAPSAEMRFRDDISRRDADAWASLLGETSLDDAIVNYRQILEGYRRKSLFR